MNKDSRQHTILVVEDYADTRLMLSLLLEMSGYRVLEASSGEEAIEAARRERANLRLILMDLSLPKMDGITTARLIRQIPELREVPIVACTGHDAELYRHAAFEAGCCHFITKPIDFDRLKDIISSMLRR